MSRLARRIGDKRLLRIVRRFLQAGMMQGGVVIERHEGTPQGGPLSPLLANLLLDDLDRCRRRLRLGELERRGHRFCRYADDCNIYIASQAAGKRLMASVTAFLTARLRLKVNVAKSAVAPVGERSFLGHRLLPGGRLGLAPKSLERAKDRLRRITRRGIYCREPFFRVSRLLSAHGDCCTCCDLVAKFTPAARWIPGTSPGTTS